LKHSKTSGRMVRGFLFVMGCQHRLAEKSEVFS